MRTWDREALLAGNGGVIVSGGRAEVGIDGAAPTLRSRPTRMVRATLGGFGLGVDDLDLLRGHA